MPTLVLVGTQWGDEGKGKVTDVLAETADLVVRYQGGANAGHTVVVDGRKYKLHLVPSGIIHGKRCVIGNGVVVDPAQLLHELDELAGQGCDPALVAVSDAAHVIMPYHKRLDELEELRRAERKLGTTGRGIGPAYMDKTARQGIRMADLLERDVFRDKLEHNLAQVNHLLQAVYDEEPFSFDALFAEYMAYADRLRPHVCDTMVLVNKAIAQGARVLFEGAQGTLLDLDHGTYPFVTSSHPVAGGACIGAGVGPARIDRVIGVAKAYTSRVGDGPFPSELSGETAAYIREKGHEYGTTTGRPRRVGWLDAVVLRLSAMASGLDGLALNHLDTLTGLDPLRIVSTYQRNGERLEYFPHAVHVLAECQPVFEDLPGWQEDISGARSFSDLPRNAQQYVRRIEALTQVPVAMISVGPGREQTFALGEVFPAQARR